jgi:D-alanine transaminase
MKDLAYYDGVIGTTDTVQVPFNDRGHFFGDGIYDATLGAGGTVFLLQEHLDRFYSGANALDIRIPMEKQALGALLTELLAKVEGSCQFVYWQVTRGTALREHTYESGMQGKLWVMITPAALPDPEQPIRLITREDTRFYHCNLKTLNLLPSVMAAQAAKERGAAEAVLHRGDTVTECAHSNVLILKDGVVFSHPNDEFVLRGITKTHLIGACYRLGVTVLEKPFTLAQLLDADEIFVTSSTKFVRCANEIDGAPAGGKAPALRRALQSAVLEEYRAAVHA